MGELSLDDLLQKKEAETAPAAELTVPTETQVAAEAEKLTPEQLSKVEEIRKSIDLSDSNILMQYGVGAERDIQSFSESILEKVRVKDTGKTGELLADLSDEVRSMKVDELFGSKIPILGSLWKSMRKFARRYETVEVQVDRISKELEKERMQMIRDVTMFDTMYDKNVEHFRELQVYIRAGEECIKEMRESTIPKLRAQAAERGDSMSAQVVRDFEENVNRFEEKIHDMKISKTIAMQTAPQIRLIQNNDRLLVDKIQTAILQTIPLWKNQIVLAIGLEHQQDILKTQRKITDTTNDLLKANSSLLKQNTEGVMKESERGIADLETLKQVNDDLIATINDSIRIQKEGHAGRVAAEKQLLDIEAQLKAALMQNADAEA
ncbi:MAG: toxic anion resistance protein [Eubacterium sp.]|nr:toxic anion resistance protein [Eubacterium sp.]